MYNNFLNKQLIKVKLDHKFIVHMSRTSFFCTLFLIIALNGMALSGYSQTVRMSMKVDNPNLKEAMMEIKSKTEFDFLYSKDIEHLYTAGTRVEVENGTIEQVLDQLFINSCIDYKIIDKTIVFMPRLQKAESMNTTVQQGITITGTVTDASGEPLPGVSVMIKGTTQGTATNANGAFSLSVPNENAALVFSYIGFTTQEVSVGNQGTINVTLVENTRQLEEVIVVGYGTQKKVNLTGAVEMVSSKTMNNRSTSNVALKLQGIVSNLIITPGSGQADDTPGFNIRGTTSINGGTPLILVDGIPTTMTDFSRINSLDIDNISVLKDAVSAAIYGARAGFGVILVTTKKGKEGKPTVQFNNSYHVRTETRLPKVVMDPYILSYYKKIMGKPWYDFYTDEEVEYAKKRRDDPSLPSVIVNKINPSLYTYLDTTDWFKEVYDETGSANSHNLSISGAGEKVSYYLGTEYYQERGLLKLNKDIMDRYNMRSRVEYKPTSWLTVGNNTALTYSDYTKPSYWNDRIHRLQGYVNRLHPVKNPDGSYTEAGVEMVDIMLEGGQTEAKRTMVSSQFTADFEIIKNVLNIKADYTAQLTHINNNSWLNNKVPYRTGPEGADKYWGSENIVSRTGTNNEYVIFNLYADARKDIGKHSLSAVGGFSQESEKYVYFYGQRRDMITNSYPTVQLATGEMQLTENKSSYAIRSAFYRFTYVFDQKYILETNGRYDGTSRFPKKDRFGFFPSVSASWVISGFAYFGGRFHHGRSGLCGS